MNENGPRIENQEELKKKILLADDDESVRVVVEMMLQKFLNCDVVSVADGQELLDKLAEGEKFDLVITDNNMPRMDGIDALKKMRQNKEFAKTPVILGTAVLGLGLRRQAEALGAKCVEKPYSTSNLKDLFDQIFP